MKALLVFCNVPDRAQAERIAQALVAGRLAACVNILAPCRSVYRWEGKVESADEIPLIIKTTDDAYPQLEQQLRALHPYQVPEIVACDIVVGLPDYLTWVGGQVFSRE
ncbi:divalent-cation tolerance protein CutA [Paludibacterium purpuratum]|uniref:Periplasmic divalent cation tolerance protein n=1 Tax=Paludibacterium purpuratum TaxID=1144873 RepID=A0A4R7B9I1_9NEIS|nr:divalent-cation tolerance protein CutA [Paludibacterium purpuratum]TDR80346.1 periplasmic divalent cation tolerance protein [Paludibacterium purpuratum]